MQLRAVNIEQGSKVDLKFRLLSTQKKPTSFSALSASCNIVHIEEQQFYLCSVKKKTNQLLSLPKVLQHGTHRAACDK